MHDDVVYRIDDHRYISIMSPHKCDGYLDGDIYYNDTRTAVRTFVSFTGPMGNGLYDGYYAVNSDPQYVAIPSLAFSQTRGMLLHVNYSHDGGRTFQWFLAGPSGPDYVILQNNQSVYWARKDLSDPKKYSQQGAILFDISHDMDGEIFHYDIGGGASTKYGKGIPRWQIPFGLESPTGQTHWTCPAVPAQ